MKTRLLMILLMAISQVLTAQTQILFQSAQTKSYLLSYLSPTDASQQVVNEMLDAIATYIPKPTPQTKITFTLEENIKITRSGNTVNIIVAFQNITFSGDIFYKTFDMSNVLVPARYEFKGSLRKEKDIVIAEFTQPATNYTAPYTESLLQYTDTIQQTVYSFVITSSRFFYDNIARDRFLNKVTLIDQYYMADADLNLIHDKLLALDPDDFENIDKTQAILNDASGQLNNIAGATFWKLLNISVWDPAKLNAKKFDVDLQLSQLQNSVNYVFSIIHQLYFDKGVDLYGKGKRTDARFSFEKSLSYRPQFAPSQYYLALISVEDQRNEDARQQIKTLLTFKTIDQGTYNATLDLMRILERRDMAGASKLITAGKYADALNILSQTELFGQSVSSFQVNDSIEILRSNCHLGIFNALMKSANDLLLTKKLDDAEVAADQAILYQQQNPKYIPSDKAATDLKQKIKIEQYYAAMKTGREMMDTKNYRAAFLLFQKAKDLEAIYPVKKDKQLPELLKKSKTEVLFLDLAEAERLVGINKLPDAREILRRVIDEQKVYDLLGNANLNTRIENLKKSIFSQQCTNAQNEYDGKISEAAAAVNEKRFIDAESLYSLALQVCDDNRDCGINTDLAISGKKSSEKPAEYQRQLTQCNDLVRTEKYQKAIDSYNALTSYFNSNSIGNSGLVHQELYMYIAGKTPNCILYGITWHTNAGELDNAFYLLKQLRQRNYTKSYTKTQQAALARSMAIRDLKAEPGMNSKLKVAGYTMSDKWYGYFTKEYLKQVKKLQ